MRLVGAVRPISSEQLVDRGHSLVDARERLLARVPEGQELVRAADRKDGEELIITGTIRPTRVEEIAAEGESYEAAKTALLAEVPAGYRLLFIRVVD